MSDLVTRVEQILEISIDAFMAWEFERIAALYVTPTPVYTTSGLRAHMSHEDLLLNLQHIRENFADFGVRGMEAKVAARSLPIEGRCHYYTEWTYDRGPGVEPLAAEVSYYCSLAQPETATPMRIEMIEYHRSALQTVRKPRPDAATLPLRWRM